MNSASSARMENFESSELGIGLPMAEVLVTRRRRCDFHEPTGYC